MAPPANTTSGTAVDITSLPYDIVQTGIHDAGTTYNVWYKHTVAQDGTLGIWGLGSSNLTTYRPTTYLYRNNPAGAAFNQYQNRPMYFPVVAGDTWYFKFEPNAGNPNPATLTLNLQPHEPQAVPEGSIAIVDVHTGYPVALLSADTDYEVLAYKADVRATEFGASILPNGIFALGVGQELVVYDANYSNAVFSGQIFGSGTPNQIVNVTSNNDDAFYCSTGAPFALTSAKVAKVSSAGAIDPTTWTLDQTDVTGICVSPNEDILYYTTNVANDPVRRWDLINDVALSDLAAGIANTLTCRNCLCLTDGTVLVLYRNSTAMTSFVRHYATDGSVIATCALDYAFSDDEDVLARDVDDDTCWVWQHDGVGVLNATPFFRQIDVATMTIAKSRALAAFNIGRYNYSETLTPLARFGGSYSCPFWITRSAAPAPPPDSDLNGPAGLDILRAQGRLVSSPIRRVRITPHTFDKNQRLYLHRVELLTAPGRATVTGQGSDPVVEYHLSKNGGETYPIQRTLTTGRLGAYTHRCYTHQLGMARDFVHKFISTDPVTSVWIDVDVEIDEGLN